LTKLDIQEEGKPGKTTGKKGKVEKKVLEVESDKEAKFRKEYAKWWV